MSTKRMPGVGKSGNWRRDLCNFTLRLASSDAACSEELKEIGVGCLASSLLSRLGFGGCDEESAVCADG